MFKKIVGVVSLLLATLSLGQAATIVSTVDGTPDNILLKAVVTRTSAETAQTGKLYVVLLLQGSAFVVDGSTSLGTLTLALPSGPTTPAYREIAPDVGSVALDFKRDILSPFGVPALDVSGGLGIEIYLGYGTDVMDMARRGNFQRLYPDASASADADPLALRLAHQPVNLAGTTQLVESIGNWMQRTSARTPDLAAFQESPDYLFAGLLLSAGWRSLVDTYDASRVAELGSDGSVMLPAAGTTVTLPDGVRVVTSGRLTLPAPAATSLPCGASDLNGYAVWLDCEQKLVTYENKTGAALQVPHSAVAADLAAINPQVSAYAISNFAATQSGLRDDLEYYRQSFYSTESTPSGLLQLVGGSNLGPDFPVGKPVPAAGSRFGIQYAMLESRKPVLLQTSYPDVQGIENYRYAQKLSIFNELQAKYAVFLSQCYNAGHLEWNNRNGIRGVPALQCNGDPDSIWTWTGDCADGIKVRGMSKLNAPNQGKKVLACVYTSWYKESLLMDTAVDSVPTGAQDILTYAIYIDKERKRQLDQQLRGAVASTLNLMVSFVPVVGPLNGVMKCFTGKSIVDRFTLKCGDATLADIFAAPVSDLGQCSLMDLDFQITNPAQNKLACLGAVPGLASAGRVLAASTSRLPAMNTFFQSHNQFLTIAKSVGKPASFFSTVHLWSQYFDAK